MFLHPLHIIPCSLLRLDIPGVQLLPATGVDFIIKGMEATKPGAEVFSRSEAPNKIAQLDYKNDMNINRLSNI